MNEFMKQAYEASMVNSYNKFQDGGPFGAVIVKDGKVIASASNTVLLSHDPTAHAEINVIRKACSILHTHDLSSCTLYTSCYPCPMCLGAIIWANIHKVYYGNTKEDAANIGFRDDDIYKVIRNVNRQKNFEFLSLKQLDRDETIKAFEEFEKVNGSIY